MVDHRNVALGLAILGGAGSLGFVAVGDPFAASTSFRTALSETGTGALYDQPSNPTASPLSIVPMTGSTASAKVDRLAMPMRLASASASTTATDVTMLHPIAYSVTTRLGADNETVVSPEIAYATLESSDQSISLDQLASLDPSLAIPSDPTETPDIAEEEDDAIPTTLAVPMPRAKPTLDASLPMPKLKPAIEPEQSVDVPNRLPEARPQPGNVGGIPLRPTQQRPSSILAMFSNPGDVQQPESPAPISHPPNTIVTPTPFGVPYVLQTQSVDTACLQPELISILRTIEGHYGRKVVVTSGYRNRGREGSLHRTCQAADIIVPGVDSHSLAAYARSIPAVGGVGTYCHASMIHVDIGTPRDWKYGCGSYFAMRDGSAHWGKVPQED
jgi:Peptidase M15